MKTHIIENIFIKILFLISLVLLFSGICFGDELVDQKNNLIMKIHSGYIQSAMAYGDILKDYAMSLFYWLVQIDLLYHMVLFWKNGDQELSEFVTMIFYRIVYAGFFLLILNYGTHITNFIYSTVVDDFAGKLIDAGTGVVGWSSGVTKVSPSDFLDIGFSICFAITEKAGFWSKTGLMTSLVAVLLMILFMLIVAEILVVMIEYYLVASIGYFLLAFGGLTHTQDVVWNYFKTLFAVAFKIMSMYSVTAIAFGFIKTFAGTTAQQNSIAGDTETLLVLLAGVCLFAILVKQVPDKMTGVIVGALAGGGAYSGVGSMIKSVLAAGAGATAATVLAAGSGAMAVQSAVTLAKAQEASGSSGGSPGGSSGSGGGSSAGSKSSGIQTLSSSGSGGGGGGTVARTAKNLMGAAKSTLASKMKGESSAANFGGTMANQMNAKTNEINTNKEIGDNTKGYKAPTLGDISNSVSGKGK